jgi:hypothetical protein
MNKSAFGTNQGSIHRVILKALEPGWDDAITQSNESDAAKTDNRNKLKEIIMHGLSCGKKMQAGITSADLAEFRSRNPVTATMVDGSEYLDSEVYYVLEREAECYAVHFLMPIYYESAGSHTDLFASVAASRILKCHITGGFDFQLCRNYCTVRMLHEAHEYDLRLIVMENVTRSSFNHVNNTAALNGVHLGLSHGNPKNKKQAIGPQSLGNPLANEGLNVRKTSNGTLISNVNSPRSKKASGFFGQ